DRHQERRRIALAREGHDLVEEVAVVLLLPPRAVARPLRAVVPALRIHAVHADQLHPAAGEVLAEGVSHAAVFPFIEAALRGRKDEGARAAVAEHEQLHVAPEARTVPAMVLTMPQDGPPAAGWPAKIAWRAAARPATGSNGSPGPRGIAFVPPCCVAGAGSA